ncbi:hypothetical protein VIC_001166 [Vibrio coralliilyticus ATCC BAA-450]|nr:hypothetical protein VIC_001166 [Vibrio coralliilyticus ATCC BAA-450]
MFILFERYEKTNKTFLFKELTDIGPIECTHGPLNKVRPHVLKHGMLIGKGGER